MGRPKALLQVDGTTFAGKLALTFSTICSPVILVTGAMHKIDAPPAVEIHNPHWREGQLRSLQAGLRAVPVDTLAFFAPVDCPLFRPETVAGLWAAYDGEATFAIPRSAGRRGHPVLASLRAIAEILALGRGAQARDVVHRHRDTTLYVDVDDEGIFADFDTPEDYRRLVSR